jgi:hypothetical protein
MKKTLKARRVAPTAIRAGPRFAATFVAVMLVVVVDIANVFVSCTEIKKH